MGQYLSAPVTDKESGEGQTEGIAYGFSSMQGWRVSMEDAHIVNLEFDAESKTSLFSVFDGHGGKAVAKYAAKHLAEKIKASPSYKAGRLGAAVTESYRAIDEDLETPEGWAELEEIVAPKKGPQVSLFGDVDPSIGEGLDADSVQGSAASGESTVKRGPRPENARKLCKTRSSSEFLASHLQRASIVPASVTASRSKDSHESPLGLFNMPGLGDDDALASEEGTAADGSPPAAVTGGASDDAASDDTAEALFATHPGLTEPSSADAEVPQDDSGRAKAYGSGCTAISALVRPGRLVVANTGDSRGVLSRRGVAIALSLDHKPILFEEARRIIRAGGFVRDNRINGSLNVSRALGDLDFKSSEGLPHTEQMVISTPDIETVSLAEGDEFLILACDGIWDVMSNQEAVDFVRRRIKSGTSLQHIAEAMCDACLAPDLTGMCRGADNMSIIIVLFRKTAHLDSMWERMWSSMWTSHSSSHRNGR